MTMEKPRKKELLNCPFCGSEADIECQGKSAWEVECMNESCGVFLPLDSWFTSRDNAINAWNTRPSDNLKPCLCPKSEAKTVKLITSQIWQCPRCGGLGSISEQAVDVPERIDIKRIIKDHAQLTSKYPSKRHLNGGDDVYISHEQFDDLAKAIHALLASGKDKQ